MHKAALGTWAVVAAVIVAANTCRTQQRESAAIPSGALGSLGARLDSLLRRVADSGFNGSVLVAKDGRVVLHQGYGWSDVSRSTPVSVSTPFWIASISKQFAAAAILKLSEQHKLSLDDSITRFLRDVPSDKQGITIHQLLTHTAGLQQRYAADGIADRDSAVQAILRQPLARPPGTEFGYSNDAYNLIAAIIEVAARKPFEAFLKETLTLPAGLRHTGFWGLVPRADVAAILSAPNASAPLPMSNWGYKGAVGVCATTEDLYRWYLALRRRTVLSDSSVRRLWQPYVRRGKLGVGYGWFIADSTPGNASVWTRGYEGFGHGAVLAAYPERELVIVVATNSGERMPNVPYSHWLAGELAKVVPGQPR